MNATPNPRRRRKASEAPPPPFNELPLSGANTEDDAGVSVALDTNSTPAAAVPLTAEPSHEGSGTATVGTEPPSAAASPPIETPSADVKSDLAAAEPSTALTVVGDVKLAMRSEQTRKDIAKLLADADAITAITNSDGRQQAHALLMLFVKARTAIDGRYEEVSVSVRSFLDDLRDERGELKESFAQSETRLRKLRDDWDAEIARQKKVKADAEAARVKQIQDAISSIRAMTDDVFGKPSDLIEAAVKDLVTLPIGEEFAEFKAAAAQEKDRTLEKLRTMYQVALDSEEKARKLAEERTELDRQRAEQELDGNRTRAIQGIRNFESTAAVAMSADVKEARRRVLSALTLLDHRIVSVEEFGPRVTEAASAKLETDANIRKLLTQIDERESREAREADDRRKAEEARAARDRAMDAIRTIQDRVHDAAEGDSLEAYDLALSLTQGESMTDERFGAMVGTARTVQTNTLATLKQRREALSKRLSEAAEFEERQRLQEVETQRLADVQADIDRQQQALRLARETVIAPTDAAEAGDGEVVTISGDPLATFTGTIVDTDAAAPSVDEAIMVTLDVLAAEWNLGDEAAKDLIVRMGARVMELRA